MTARDYYTVEAIESRMLLSSTPGLVINYTQRGSFGAHAQADSGGIDCYTDVPLHVTALATDDATGATDLHDTTDSANELVKANFTWEFGDPTGAYNVLPGFNAAHIYRTPGTYTLTLSVVDEDGYAAIESVTVRVAQEPFDDPSSNGGIVYYVAATATGDGRGGIPAMPQTLAGLLPILVTGISRTTLRSSSKTATRSLCRRVQELILLRGIC